MKMRRFRGRAYIDEKRAGQERRTKGQTTEGLQLENRILTARITIGLFTKQKKS